MTSEERTERFGISLVRPEAFQICAGTAAAVIQQYGGERTSALRAPEHRTEGSRPTLDNDGFRRAGRLAPSHCERQR